MSVAHFFAGAPAPGETVVLSADDAHHARRSLRIGEGDRFSSSDGEGGLVRCRVLRSSALLVEGVVEERSEEPRPVPVLTVLLAPPKGERLRWAVQKLTEVGVDRIVLVEAPRSIRRWEGDRAARTVARLSAVATEAAKQSRRRFLPAVVGPVPWSGAVEDAVGTGPVVLLWERATDPLSTVLPDAPSALGLAIGPEGGVGESDARAAEAAGASSASLGPQILRTETAAVVAASLALSRYGRLG